MSGCIKRLYSTQSLRSASGGVVKQSRPNEKGTLRPWNNGLAITVKFYVAFFLIHQCTNPLTSFAQDLEKIGKKDAFKVNGGLNYNSVYYNSTGMQARRDPYSWFLSGNLNLNAIDYSIPLSFTYSNQHGTFNQPFNRVSISPKYKWAKAHVGITNMNFSNYTLAGHIFAGAGIELTPGKWNFSALYGQFQKAVQYDFENASETNMAFKRTGYGFKGGYDENGKSFSVIYFAAVDDPSSLIYVPSTLLLMPKQNTVVSFLGKSKLFKNFTVEGEYALSALQQNNRFINDAAGSTQVVKPYLFLPATKANYYNAYRAALSYGFKVMNLQLNYERIDPGYQTLGAYYFNSDMENITIAPSFNLFKGKLVTSFNTGVQRNNLDRQKQASLVRWVGSVSVNYMASKKMQLSGMYSNFSSFTRNRPQVDPFYVQTFDTLKFYQVTQNAMCNASYTFGNEKVKQTLNLNSAFQTTAQEQGGTENKNVSILNGNISYNLNQMATKSVYSFIVNGNRNNSTQAYFLGPGINYAKALLQDRLKLSAGTLFSLQHLNSTSNQILNYRINAAYSPKLKNKNAGNFNFSLSANYVQRYSVNNTAELNAMLNAVYSF